MLIEDTVKQEVEMQLESQKKRYTEETKILRDKISLYQKQLGLRPSGYNSGIPGARNNGARSALANGRGGVQPKFGGAMSARSGNVSRDGSSTSIKRVKNTIGKPAAT